MIATAKSFEWDFARRATVTQETAAGMPTMGKFGFQDAPVLCAHCGERLTVPFIFWRGNLDLGFHEKCALRLGSGIVRDVQESLHGKETADGLHESRKASYLLSRDKSAT